MKKNGFVPLILILIISILGVVGYFGYNNLKISKPISSDMSSWKTYTNNEVGFSFKYPSNYTNKIGGSNRYLGLDEVFVAGDDTNKLLSVWTGTNSSRLIAEAERYSSSKKEIGSQVIYLSSMGPYGGEYFYEFTIPYGKYFIYVNVGTSLYEENKDINGLQLKTFESLRDQILNTFKFVK